MRHLKRGRKFGRIKGRRRSFLAILMHNLIMEGRIQTTEARAKEIRPQIEKLVTLAKRGNLVSLRLLMRRIPKDAAYKLYHDIAPRYKDRNGGYLRIIKTASARKRDGVEKVIIEFV
jgi:large subunit ribosomal protein L17